MPAKPHTFPEIRAMMVSFDLIPGHDEGLVQMVRYDLSRMKGATKHKRALSECNAYRVWRSEKAIKIHFLDMSKPEERRTRFSMVYELTSPFA
jgi:hypothetical protein